MGTARRPTPRSRDSRRRARRRPRTCGRALASPGPRASPGVFAAWAVVAALASFAALVPACAGTPAGPVAPVTTLGLVNRTGAGVEGAVLRFDRELTRIEQVSSRGFPDRSLRLSPADTVRLAGATLAPGDHATYRFTAAAGPPVLVEARWIVGGKLGPRLGPEEAVVYSRG